MNYEIITGDDGQVQKIDHNNISKGELIYQLATDLHKLKVKTRHAPELQQRLDDEIRSHTEDIVLLQERTEELESKHDDSITVLQSLINEYDHEQNPDIKRGIRAGITAVAMLIGG